MTVEFFLLDPRPDSLAAEQAKILALREQDEMDLYLCEEADLSYAEESLADEQDEMDLYLCEEADLSYE